MNQGELILEFKWNGYLIPLIDCFAIAGGGIEAPGFYCVKRCLIQPRITAAGFYFDRTGCAVTFHQHPQHHHALFIESL